MRSQVLEMSDSNTPCEYGDGATLPPLCSSAGIHSLQSPGLRKNTLGNSRNLKIQNISMTLRKFVSRETDTSLAGGPSPLCSKSLASSNSQDFLRGFQRACIMNLLSYMPEDTTTYGSGPCLSLPLHDVCEDSPHPMELKPLGISALVG